MLVAQTFLYQSFDVLYDKQVLAVIYEQTFPVYVLEICELYREESSNLERGKKVMRCPRKCSV
jgi:hypothetical protein